MIDHTDKRIFEGLRDEYGFDGRYTIVEDYVRERRRQSREMFVPPSHPPGHAQCDFGEARVVIGGVERKAHYFVLDLPHSDGCFVKAYPAETTEAFCDSHISAFAFLGGVPQSIPYDNTRLAAAMTLGDGWRKRTRSFSELQSHHLFEVRFGRPGRGKVEGMVGYVRRNFPVRDVGVLDVAGLVLWEHRIVNPLFIHASTSLAFLVSRILRTSYLSMLIPFGGIGGWCRSGSGWP